MKVTFLLGSIRLPRCAEALHDAIRNLKRIKTTIRLREGERGEGAFNFDLITLATSFAMPLPCCAVASLQAGLNLKRIKVAIRLREGERRNGSSSPFPIPSSC